MAVFRSLKALYVQLIDDDEGTTVFSLHAAGTTVEIAKTLGAEVAAVAKKKGIRAVVFDRGGFRYHGGIKALADAAREGGLTL